MKIIKVFFPFLFAGILFTGCNQNRFKINTNKSDLDIKIERFDKEVFALDTNNIMAGIPALQEKYGDFWNIYVQQILELGPPDSISTYVALRDSLASPLFRGIYEEGLKIFDDVSWIEKKLTVAFKYIEHYFPGKKIPRIYMHVSELANKVVTTSDALSLSTDNYLGTDYIYPVMVYEYQLPGMTPEKAPSDYMKGYLLSEFPFYSFTNTLLDNMLYNGKLMFLLETIMPDEKEETLMSYTPEQLKWCYDNEKPMWVTMAENKHLFSTDRMVATKYIDDAPFTAFFPRESPGRAGTWIGWQIIRSYMKNNKNVTLKELMNESDYGKILEKSGYQPK